MRTKNAKRLWPVPATLAVMALAALLAFGLMATNGAQPAAAQDDADCELTFTEAGLLDSEVHETSPVSDLGIPITCDAKGDTATVKVNGPIVAFADDATEFVRFYIEDNSGALAAFAPGEAPTWITGNSRYEIGGVAASTKKYRFMKVDIPEVETNPSTGRPVRGSDTFTVNKSKGGVVYIYTGETLELTEPKAAGEPPEDRQQRGLINAQGAVTITFLGAPAIGEDRDTDSNNKLDDAIMDQCIADDGDDNNNADQDLVGEAMTNGCVAAGNALTPAQLWEVGTVTDVTESRSKLVVRTVADDGTPQSADATPIIDGKMGNHIIAGPDDTVTIYAVVKDEEGEALLGTEVSFSTTTMPAGIVAPRALSDDVDTEEAVTGAGTLEDDQTRVTGFDPDGDNPGTGLAIDGGDAVASYTLDSLPDGKNDSYRLEVVVTAGDLTLGTVVIARTGPAEKIVAGVFNAECFPEPMVGDPEDFLDNKFNAEAKDCDASGMARRFGAGETFVVKAHHEDTRDLVVGAGSDLSVEFANEDDDLLGDESLVDFDDPVMEGDPAQAWVYTVDADATLGDHMITVSTDETNADDDAIDDVTLTVTVAGPPHELSVSGDANIPLGQSVTYIVTATDELGGVPHVTEGENDKVSVNVQPADALVTGADNAGQVKLGADGTAEFTVFASLDADDGDPGRIIVQLGDIQEIQTIIFGAPAPEMTVPGMPMSVMAMADGHGTINVSWEAPASDGNSAITGYMVERGYMDADNMMMWMTVAEMTTDMMYMDTGLMAKTKYYYRVTAMNSIGSGMASDGMAMATTGVAPAVPMAYGMLDAVMLTVGDDAHMVDVSGAFMEADGDDVTYTAMSDNDMVATASADGSMVSIMAVAAGSATVTVTATDKDGSATQDISVTVSAAPVASYAIAVPDRIEAGMTGTITVTAQDANGNATAGGTVTVSLSGDDDMVTAIGLSNNQLELGTDSSMGSFRIFANADATSGSVTITVIGEAGVDTVSEMVRIGPNQNPMAGDDIADQMVLVGGTATVESTLSDHEGDDLTYTVSSSDDMIATATNDGAMITITGVAAGDATITVTGMDTEMGSGMQTIMVTVKEPNTAPMAGDDVADQMVYVGAMVEVQSNFSDPDEDMLSYTADSSDDMIATATVDDMGMVTITGVAEGMSTITVTASDPMGESAMQTIMVTVMMMPPMELGAPSITSVMSDPDGMATVMLMPGDNATKHYIWAQPTDLSQGMYSDEAAGDADMVTISGLTSGMNYWFIAVAGRGTGADSEWSEWSGWTAETPIQ